MLVHIDRSASRLQGIGYSDRFTAVYGEPTAVAVCQIVYDGGRAGCIDGSYACVIISRRAALRDLELSALGYAVKADGPALLECRAGLQRAAACGEMEGLTGLIGNGVLKSTCLERGVVLVPHQYVGAELGGVAGLLSAGRIYYLLGKLESGGRCVGDSNVVAVAADGEPTAFVDRSDTDERSIVVCHGDAVVLVHFVFTLDHLDLRADGDTVKGQSPAHLQRSARLQSAAAAQGICTRQVAGGVFQGISLEVLAVLELYEHRTAEFGGVALLARDRLGEREGC